MDRNRGKVIGRPGLLLTGKKTRQNLLVLYGRE